MDNASKALLIATAILIAIVLIALGIKILDSTKNSSESAQAIGESLSSTTSSATIKLILSMDNYKDDTKFKDYIETNYGNGKALTKDNVIEVCELIMARTRKFYNKDYLWKTIHIPSTEGLCEIYYNVSDRKVDYTKLTSQKYYELTWATNPSDPKSIKILINIKD